MILMLHVQVCNNTPEEVCRIMELEEEEELSTVPVYVLHKVHSFLCCLRSTAAYSMHWDHFVRCLCVCVSVCPVYLVLIKWKLSSSKRNYISLGSLLRNHSNQFEMSELHSFGWKVSAKKACVKIHKGWHAILKYITDIDYMYICIHRVRTKTAQIHVPWKIRSNSWENLTHYYLLTCRIVVNVKV